MNTLRGLLNATAIMCVIYWGAAALAGYAYTWLLLVAAVIFLVTGYATYTRRPTLTSELTHTPSHAIHYIDGGKQPAWRDDILRRDPAAYPLTKRAVWPADEWSVE